MICDAKFLAGVFFEFDVPRENNFIFQYFRSPLEHQFVRYYLCFGEIDNFVDHTGYFCQKRWLRILKKRFDNIKSTYDSYKKEFKLKELEELENGGYEISQKIKQIII